MKRAGRASLLLLLAGLGCGTADGQDVADLGRIAVRSFGPKDGLVASSIETLAFSKDGHLYLGTADGALSFDGRTFRPLELPGTAAHAPVTSILHAADGSLWVATAGQGVHRLQSGAWTSFDVRAGLPSNDVCCLAEHAGSVWAGTAEGLARLTGQRAERYPGLARVTALLATEGPEGQALRIGTPRGLIRLSAGRLQVEREGLEVTAIDEEALPDGEPLLSIGSARGDVLRSARGSWSPEPTADLLPSRITGLESTPDGTRWVAAPGRGILRLGGGAPVLLGAAQGLPSLAVTALRRDPSDPSTLWAGTREGTLLRLRAGGFVALDERSGLPSRSVWAFLETRAGDEPTHWFGTSAGLARFQRGRFTVDGASSGLPAGSQSCLLEAPGPGGKPTVWVGTDLGLFRREPRGRYLRDARVPVTSVLSLLADGGTLWAGTERGLFQLERAEGRAVEAAGLARNAVTCLLKTTGAHPALWAGTRGGGLARYAEGSWQLFDGAAGLTSTLVSCLLEAPSPDGRPALWVGTYGGGVFLLEDGAARLRPLAAPLPSGGVTRLERDRRGRVWVLTNRGIARLTLERGTVNAVSYGVEDGLPSEECNQGASYLDRRGRLWAGTTSGAALLETDGPEEELAPKPLRLERTALDGAAVSLGARPLPNRARSLSFEFALFSPFRPADARYRTQLVGLEDRPSAWSGEPRKEYTTLPPGHYRFRVWGRDYRGQVSGPLEVPFSVKPPAWLSWWAFLGYAAVAAALASGMLRAHRRAVERRAAEVERRLSRRTRQLEETLARRAASKIRVLQVHKRLEEVQEKIDQLAEQSIEALRDVDAWSHSVAEDMRAHVSAERIAVFRMEDGDLVSAASPAATPPALSTLRELARKSPTFEGEPVLVPVTGLTGEVFGALRVEGKRSPWEVAEKRLMVSFAHQLGGALEHNRLRQQVAAAAARRAASRQEMLVKGEGILRLCPRCRRCYNELVDVCYADGARLNEPRLFPYRIQGRYRVRHLLGEGGMGQIFDAHDERLDRDVAVKVLRPELFEHESLRQRFQLEARALARIAHPGVTEIFDSGQLPDGSVFYVMERLHGLPLKLLVKMRGPGTPQQVALVLRQAAAGLAAAHRAGLVHRDIKPDNVFLAETADGRAVKLLDFGVVKTMESPTGLTTAGMIVGTPPYMSPEQIQGEDLDERSDVYSFAAVIVEALTGAPWLKGANLGEIFEQMMEDVSLRLQAALAGFPISVRELFTVALERFKEDRPADVELWARALAAELERLPSRVPGWPVHLLELVDEHGWPRPEAIVPQHLQHTAGG